MEAFKFVLSGDTAFFKKPDVNVKVYFTYNNIHKIALCGILGAIIGLEGYKSVKVKGDYIPEFYEKLKNLEICIMPNSSKGYFSKKIQYFNNSVGYANNADGGNLQVKEQWLYSPSWTILIKPTPNLESGLWEKIKDYLLNGKCVYDEILMTDDEAFLYRQFNNCKIVLTSHINFFNSLFGIKREQCFPLIKLCNSVVILDEIQSYKNEIWQNIIQMFDKYSKLLNIKIIIMSATLPKLSNLIENTTSSYVDLIQNKDIYFQNPIFKNRVIIDNCLLKFGKIELNILKEKILEHKGKKILVEFIKKKSARVFFNLIKSETENVYELTGDDNILEREKVIKIPAASCGVLVGYSRLSNRLNFLSAVCACLYICL